MVCELPVLWTYKLWGESTVTPWYSSNCVSQHAGGTLASGFQFHIHGSQLHNSSVNEMLCQRKARHRADVASHPLLLTRYSFSGRYLIFCATKCSLVLAVLCRGDSACIGIVARWHFRMKSALQTKCIIIIISREAWVTQLCDRELLYMEAEAIGERETREDG